MYEIPTNKYRAAVLVLQRGRDVLVGTLADEILDQADDLIDGGFAFNELLETQGTRLHFLGLLVAQLEQSAETRDEEIAAEEAQAPPPPKPVPKKRKPRAKKVTEQAAAESTPDEG